MIIVRLQGGLGNQMFQHALGRKLSLLHHTEMYYDDLLMRSKIDAPSHTHRDFELDIFQGVQKIADPELTEKIKNASPSFSDRIYHKIRRRYIPYYRRRMIYEKEWFQYDDNLLKTPHTCYLDGYWQNTKYFEGIEQQLRKDFIFPELDTLSQQLISDIHKTNSVSIHIRLGDYKRNKWAEELHGNICDASYYAKAIEIMNQKTKKPLYYLFSDEPEVAKDILGLSHNYILVHQNAGKDSWKDMYLMSRCKHNIIANSSFSWWGAWLNTNPQKIVIRPKKWINQDKDTSGLTLTNGIEL